MENMQIEIDLIQFSTGKPHPLAVEKTIYLGPSNPESQSYAATEIAGDFLVMIVPMRAFERGTATGDRLCVFEWRTGDLRMVCNPSNLGIQSNRFLNTLN